MRILFLLFFTTTLLSGGWFSRPRTASNIKRYREPELSPEVLAALRAAHQRFQEKWGTSAEAQRHCMTGYPTRAETFFVKRGSQNREPL